MDIEKPEDWPTKLLDLADECFSKRSSLYRDLAHALENSADKIIAVLENHGYELPEEV